MNTTDSMVIGILEPQRTSIIHIANVANGIITPRMESKHNIFSISPTKSLPINSGDIGVWTFKGKTNNVVYQYESPLPIEIIPREYENSTQILEYLNQGIKVSYPKIRHFFLFKNRSQLYGILCDPSQTVIIENNVIKLHKNIYSLPIYPIDDYQIVKTKKINRINELYFYYLLTPPDATDYVSIYPPIESIKLFIKNEIISQFSNYIDIIHQDSSSVQNIFNTLPNNLTERIVKSCHFSDEDSKKYLSTLNEYIDIKDIILSTIDIITQKYEYIKERFQKNIDTSKYEKEINEKEKIIQNLNNKQEKVSLEIKKLNEEYNKKKKQNDERINICELNYKKELEIKQNEFNINLENKQLEYQKELNNIKEEHLKKTFSLVSQYEKTYELIDFRNKILEKRKIKYEEDLQELNKKYVDFNKKYSNLQKMQEQYDKDIDNINKENKNIKEKQEKIEKLKNEYENQKQYYEQEKKNLDVKLAEEKNKQKISLESLHQEIEKAKEEQNMLRKQIESYRSLEQKTLEHLREKLSTARQDASELLADLTICGAGGQQQASVYFSSGRIPQSCNAEPDLLELLSDNVEDAGAIQDYSRELASFLFAAFLNSIPLLLVGRQGLAIANAISCSLTGRYAAVLDCCGEWSPTVLNTIEASEDKVIVVKNAFTKRWIDYFLTELESSNKMWIFLHPFADDLPLQPASLYHYILPVLLDAFVVKALSTELACCSPQRAKEMMAERQEQARLSLQKIKLKEERDLVQDMESLHPNPYLKDCLSKVVQTIFDANQSCNISLLVCAYLFFPLAIALGKKEKFLEILPHFGLQDKEKEFFETALEESR